MVFKKFMIPFYNRTKLVWTEIFKVPTIPSIKVSTWIIWTFFTAVLKIDETDEFLSKAIVFRTEKWIFKLTFKFSFT